MVRMIIVFNLIFFNGIKRFHTLDVFIKKGSSLVIFRRRLKGNSIIVGVTFRVILS